MVDEVRVLRLLRGVADELGVLESEAGASQDRRADVIWLRGVKYAFISVIEGCVDVAQHLCSSEGWGPPHDNGDAMRILAEHGVLEPVLGASMRRAVGFRNVLVHEYTDVDDAVVLVQLADLTDLRGFAAQVAGWMRQV